MQDLIRAAGSSWLAQFLDPAHRQKENDQEGKPWVPSEDYF